MSVFLRPSSASLITQLADFSHSHEQVQARDAHQHRSVRQASQQPRQLDKEGGTPAAASATEGRHNCARDQSRADERAPSAVISAAPSTPKPKHSVEWTQHDNAHD